jgi:predicted Rossmann fold nucleotide-binding protein DprA/Smf involved in DNA uptake
VISRADTKYPRRLKAKLKEDAPPLLYGCGDIALLEKGGLAVVGSRHVDDELIRYTENVGRLSAEAHRSIVSGGAKGIDRAAMHGALMAGGDVAGVMADSLEKAALARDNREPLMDGRLVLISPYDPAAGFNVGHAMQRNKLIYALADAALVVSSDFEKGGTWAGAIEQLDRLHFVPVFVRNGTHAGKGNAALLNRGGKPWPNPQSGNELGQAIVAATEAVAAEPKQENLPFTLREGSPTYEAAQVAKPAEAVSVKDGPELIDVKLSPEAELLNTVREILRCELAEARTEEEVAALLGVTKPQAKAWLARLVKESVIEKVKKSKPPQFRTVTKAERLI